MMLWKHCLSMAHSLQGIMAAKERELCEMNWKSFWLKKMLTFNASCSGAVVQNGQFTKNLPWVHGAQFGAFFGDDDFTLYQKERKCMINTRITFVAMSMWTQVHRYG